MKLRLALSTVELALRSHVSTTSISSIFITWIKLVSKELSVLIVWSSQQQVRKTLPSCFVKLYPKVRCIIDCFEYFTETASELDLVATLWSEYKQHYTFKWGYFICFILWRKGFWYFHSEKLDFWTWLNLMTKLWQTGGLRRVVALHKPITSPSQPRVMSQPRVNHESKNFFIFCPEIK